jgi:Domain of unknown function (DUF1963)
MIEAVHADPILAPYVEALESYGRSSIRLRPARGTERYPAESRVGGRPAVPVGFQWPKRHVEMPTPSPAWIATQSIEPRLLPPDGTSTFEFIAQIDLENVAPYDADGLLPHEGTLLFFYDELYQSDIDPDSGLKPTSWTSADWQPKFYMREFGFDQVDQVRVIHVPAGPTLRLSDDGPHAPYALQLVASQDRTLPSTDCYVLTTSTGPAEDLRDRVVLSPEAGTRLNEFWYEHRANADIDQMLGWADNGAHGPSIPPEHDRGWGDIPIADRLRETQDARLLLQLSPATYEPTGIRFGRTLYFYARESDLRRGDFSRAWYDSD